MDIRTLYICLILLLLMFAVCFAVVRRSERDLPSSGWVSLSFACFALGFLLAVSREAFSPIITIGAGNAALILAYLLLHQGVSRFLERPMISRSTGVAISVVGILGVIAFTYLIHDVRIRIVIMSVAAASIAGRTAWHLFSSDPHAQTREPRLFLGWTLLILALFNVVRGAHALIEPGRDRLLVSSPVETAMLLAFTGIAVATGFGFIWMTGARIRLMLQDQAHRDPLTGLLNRRGFLVAATARLRSGWKDGGRTLMLYADLDGLKEINDTAGHQAGDNIIRDAAMVLQDVLRASDIVARLGGDEFCALVQVSTADDSAIILDRLEHRVRARNQQAPGRTPRLSISAAAVEVPDGGAAALEEVLNEVDGHMYRIKRERKAGAVREEDPGDG